MIIFFGGAGPEMLQRFYSASLFYWNTVALQCCQFLQYQHSESVSGLHTSPPSCCLPATAPPESQISTEHRAPRAMQQLPTSQLFYTWWCQSQLGDPVSPNSCHHLAPLPCVHTSVLYICVYSCPVSQFFCTSCLDSTYMRCECMLRPVPRFASLWTIAHQAPLSRKVSGKNTGVGCIFSSYICLLPYNICFSLPDLLHSV